MRRIQTPISDAFLPDMKSESRYLSQAIELDSLALRNESARFGLEEQKKDALRRDYEWDARVAIDEMRDEHLGGILESINKLDPADPESGNNLKGIMGNIPPELYGDKMIQGAIGMMSYQVSKNERFREHELGSMRTAALSEIKRMGKDPEMGRYAYDATGRIAGASNVDEMRAVLDESEEVYSGVVNNRGQAWIQDNVLSGDIDPNIASKYGLVSGDDIGSNLSKIAIAMGEDPRDPRYATERGKATLIPRIIERLQKDQENVDKMRTVENRTGSALVNDVQQDARKKISRLTSQRNAKFKKSIEGGAKIDTSYEDRKIKEAQEVLAIAVDPDSTDEEIQFNYRKILDLPSSASSQTKLGDE